ncbi:MAG: phytanoyl-CoA dioxygenase family protein [Verrucomicrobia bacterium]|nr:phytanoyl-CoA dioxygenase family protein [Verrucomicrobiota bacterium]
MATFDGPKLAALRAQFQRDGYLVLQGYFSSARIDGLLAEVARLLREHPLEIVVDSRLTGQRAWWADTPYRETERHKLNDLYLLSDMVRGCALDEPLAGLLAALLQEPAVLCNSLNLGKGSADEPHIDSLFMTPRTPGALAATWIALEDVHADSGPLTYFPGSHRIPLHHFSDGTRHAIRGEMPVWFDYIQRELKARGIEEQVFLAKKGDVFIWHSDLVHSGSPIRDMRCTRTSMVCHYFTESDTRAQGCDLVPLHGGYWMRRLAQPVTVPPEVFEAGRRFPEENYLARHADVKAAVAAGHWPSGYQHYKLHGFKEGRGI